MKQVWDLRAIRNKTEPLAHFTYHKQPITSIEWAAHDESMLCVASEDNQITVWDLSVETDDETLFQNGNQEKKLTANETDLPPQLLFIHQGQKEIKEIHFHPQIPGVIMSTAEDSLDLFKPAINVLS
jgi:ribosome assembly protein RRB1